MKIRRDKSRPPTFVHVPAPGRAGYFASLPEHSEIRLDADSDDDELCVSRDGRSVIVWTRRRRKET